MELPQATESMSATAPEMTEVKPDRRKYKRYPVEIQAYVVGVPFPERSDGYWEIMRPDSDPAIITNLSGAGLHFTSRAYFEISDQVWIAMGLDREMQPVRAIVVHRHDFKDENGGEYFGYGVQFVRSDFAPAAVAAVLKYLNRLQNAGRRSVEPAPTRRKIHDKQT